MGIAPTMLAHHTLLERVVKALPDGSVGLDDMDWSREPQDPRLQQPPRASCAWFAQLDGDARGAGTLHVCLIS